LRNKNIFDDIIYKNITLLNKLILQSPGFTNNVIVYRFIDNDSYLKDIQIGDIYITDSFLSCSRNPKINEFGSIVNKIRISKNMKGIGLCIEGYSMYPKEEEIILPPSTMMKLLSKTKDEYDFEIVNVAKFEITKPISLSCPIYDFEEFYFSMDTFEKQVSHLFDNVCHNNFLFKLKFYQDIFLFTVIYNFCNSFFF
jgi:hypothetical protein